MTTAKRRIPINNLEGNIAPEDETSPAASPSGAPAEGPALQAEITCDQGEFEAVGRERDALADSLLRARAEFDNFRKRAGRELMEARDKAKMELLVDFLPVLDNLERALDAAEHHDEGKVLGGVRLTRDLFTDLLRRSGVEEIQTVGASFDPQIHDAMMVRESDEEEGTVIAVLERGYRQADRILRPARVAVSSGPSATPSSYSTL